MPNSISVFVLVGIPTRTRPVRGSLADGLFRLLRVEYQRTLMVQLADTKKEDSSLEPSSKTQNNSQIQISQTRKFYKFHSQNLVRYPNSLVL